MQHPRYGFSGSFISGSKRAPLKLDLMLRRPQIQCSFKAAHQTLSLLRYTLMPSNFHCPNKAYVKRFRLISVRYIRVMSVRVHGWASERISLCLKRVAGPEIPLPLREQASRHKGNGSLHPLHHQGERCPEENVLTSRGVSSAHVSLEVSYVED